MSQSLKSPQKRFVLLLLRDSSGILKGFRNINSMITQITSIVFSLIRNFNSYLI